MIIIANAVLTAFKPHDSVLLEAVGLEKFSCAPYSCVVGS